MSLAMGISDDAGPLPVRLVARPGAARDRVLASLADAQVLETSPDALRDMGPEPALILLVPDALDPAELLDLLALAASPDRAWIPVLVDPEASAPTGLVVSIVATDLDAVLSFAASAGRDHGIAEIRDVLRRGSKARHDLNNPLTSALAEVQLLLLDTTDPELRVALETVQAQLLRIRDLVVQVPSVRELRRRKE